MLFNAADDIFPSIGRGAHRYGPIGGKGGAPLNGSLKGGASGKVTAGGLASLT